MAEQDRERQIFKHINLAIPENPKEPTVLKYIPRDEVQDALNTIWNLLHLPTKSVQDKEIGSKLGRSVPPSALRRLGLKIVLGYTILPSACYLVKVATTDKESRGQGSFADVYKGSYKGDDVALKLLRNRTKEASLDVDKMKQQEVLRSFYRESFVWMDLRNEHVLSFLGVSREAFPEVSGSICMVLPWIENGNIRQHIAKLREQGQLSKSEFFPSVHRWLHQAALGLAYLHDQQIVHGDLHGGNILIDAGSNALLTDFGISLLSEANTGNYGFSKEGGAYQYRAPELIDPEHFDINPLKNQPSSQSDVYAFAFTSIEVYLDGSPFRLPPNVSPDSAVWSVFKRVMAGVRPPRPSTPDGEEMPSNMWGLMCWCWEETALHRPSSRSLAENMAVVVAGGIPEIPVRVPKAVISPPRPQSESLPHAPISAKRRSMGETCCIIS